MCEQTEEEAEVPVRCVENGAFPLRTVFADVDVDLEEHLPVPVPDHQLARLVSVSVSCHRCREDHVLKRVSGYGIVARAIPFHRDAARRAQRALDLVERESLTGLAHDEVQVAMVRLARTLGRDGHMGVEFLQNGEKACFQCFVYCRGHPGEGRVREEVLERVSAHSVRP